MLPGRQTVESEVSTMWSMSRVVLLVTAAVLTSWVPTARAGVAQADEADAAATAVDLSRLEAASDFNTLYDRIHPDVHAVVPRAAVIGWFQNEWAPLGPGVSTVTGVRFVAWTWEVTGVTYPFTAEVSFEQPFADGSIRQDVVRLVPDAKGEWRWFFGRSRAFVDEQIARYVPAAPIPSDSDIFAEFVLADIDEFWRASFAGADRAYAAPGLVAVDAPIDSSCGVVDPTGPGAFCGVDHTIYYSSDHYEALVGGGTDFAWITVVAHEWGHYVQHLLAVARPASNAYELQADCLAGSYARDAGTRGLLEPGDVTEAVAMSSRGGDPLWLPQDQPGAHGTSDDRITSFMRGYLDGFVGCQLSIADGAEVHADPVPEVGQTRGVEVDLSRLLPTDADVSADLAMTADGSRSLAEVTTNYRNPAEATARFAAWGWGGNAARSFAADDGIDPSPGGASSVYVSIHRFADAAGAALALDYSAADQAAATGAVEVPTGPIGSRSRALELETPGGVEATVYTQVDRFLIRVTVVAAGDAAIHTARRVTAVVIARAV